MFVKKIGNLKPIKYDLLPFGVYFKSSNEVNLKMLFTQTDRQIDRHKMVIYTNKFKGETHITIMS